MKKITILSEIKKRFLTGSFGTTRYYMKHQNNRTYLNLNDYKIESKDKYKYLLSSEIKKEEGTGNVKTMKPIRVSYLTLGQRVKDKDLVVHIRSLVILRRHFESPENLKRLPIKTLITKLRKYDIKM